MKTLIACLVTLLVAGGCYYIYKTESAKAETLVNLSSEKIVKDLDGKAAPLPYGQVWPFDPTQGLQVKVVQKKRSDDLVILVVDVNATAKVNEQGKKDDKRLPAKLNLKGLVKLTYEQIGTDWYLMNLDSISLKAIPVGD